MWYQEDVLQEERIQGGGRFGSVWFLLLKVLSFSLGVPFLHHRCVMWRRRRTTKKSILTVILRVVRKTKCDAPDLCYVLGGGP